MASPLSGIVKHRLDMLGNWANKWQIVFKHCLSERFYLDAFLADDAVDTISMERIAVLPGCC